MPIKNKLYICISGEKQIDFERGEWGRTINLLNLITMNDIYKTSYYRIRNAVGLLGMAMPILLLGINQKLLPSISHYYYSKVSFIFTAILFAFALFLITYKGYNKGKGEIISDNLLTNIAGVFALLVIIFPTRCEIPSLCDPCNQELYDHFIFHYSTSTISTIHLCSAGLFLVMMGGMSFFKFPMGKYVKFNQFYKAMGIVVWLSIAIIGISHIPGVFKSSQYLTFIFENVALMAFGVSWVVKGKLFSNMN